MKEIWKPVPGYPWYEASTLGRVRVLDRVRHSIRKDTGREYSKFYKAKVRVLRKDPDGYLVVTLTHQDRPSRIVFVHRIIARTFHGKPPTRKHQVLHLDDDPQNNKPSNLRWGTCKQNMEDKVAKGRQARGSSNGAAVLDENEVQQIAKLIRGGLANYKIAERFSVSGATVGNIARGRQWSHVTGFAYVPPKFSK